MNRELTKQEIEENGICPTCRGEGQYGTLTPMGGMQVIEYHFCEECDGTGFELVDGDID